MRKITFYSNVGLDMERLKSSLKAHDLTGRFHLEKYRNPLKTEEDIHDFVKKYFESDIFIVRDCGSYGSKDLLAASLAIDLGDISDTIHLII